MIALKQAPEILEPLTSGTRSNLVDIVKGMAIILVVYGHTAQGLVHRKWWDTPGAAFAHSFIYSFHMAACLFAAGLFVQRSKDHRGAKRLALEKIKGNL
jgi:fucose 4-O-acetylase-like acetyltransferase